METKIEFSYKDRDKNIKTPIKFHFILILRTKLYVHQMFFYTYSDLSGFGIDATLFSNPYDFVTLGIAIIAEKEFIKNEVEKHLND